MARYTGLYGMDLTPEELEAGFLDISQAQGTPTYKIPEFDRYSYAARNFGALPSMYELYLSGRPSTTPEAVQAMTQDPAYTGAGGAGDAAQIPEAIDTLVAPPAMDQAGAVAAMTDDLAYTGGDTTMPPMLTSDMGADSFIDTTPDYSLLDHSGHPMAKETVGIGTTPPDTIGPQPVNIIERETTHPMAKETVGIGTTPPDTIGPQPVNIVERETTHPIVEMRGDITPAVETVPGPFDYLQPEETYADLLERQTIPMSYTIPGGGEITVDETGGVQPGTIGDIVEEPTLEQEISQAPMDPTMMIPQVPPYTDPIMDPDLMGIRQNQLVSQQETPESIGEKLRSLKDVTYDPEKNTVEIAGRKFNLLGTAVRAAINTMVGKPVSLLFDALQAIPQYEPTFEERTLEEELGVTEDGKFSGDPNTSAFAGMNAVSAFGDPVQSAKDRIEKRLETIENNPDISAEFKANTKTMIDEWEAVTDKLGNVEGPIDTLGDTEISLTQRFADQMAAEKAEAERVMQEQIAAAEAAEAEAARIEAERRRLQEINAIQQGSGDGPQVVDAGTADIQDFADIYEPPAAPSYSPPSPHGNGGGNQGGSQQATSGGGFSSGWGGGWGWSKGGIVSLKNGKR